MKLFYRVHKSTKKLPSNLKYLKQIPSIHVRNKSKERDSENYLQRNTSKNCNTFSKSLHNLKIIIAKKSRIKNRNNGYEQPNVKRLKKHNSTNFSSNTKETERTRSDVEFCSYFASSSQSSPTSPSSLKISTLSENKSSISNDICETVTYQNSISKKKSTLLEKKAKNNDEKSQKSVYTIQNNNNKKERNQKVQLTSTKMKANIPKLKVGIVSAIKNKITVPSTEDKSNFDSNEKSESLSKNAHFEDVNEKSLQDQDDDVVDQLKYAHQIGLRPVVRTVESIILHRKRKKSKHSKGDDYCKRQKVHVSSSLNENLKLKLKIMGKNSYKNSKNVDDNCNFNSHSSARLISTCNQHNQIENENEKQTKRADTERKNSTKNKEGGGLENYKYSLTEQHNVEFGSDSTSILIPKLVINSNLNEEKVSSKEKETSIKDSQNLHSDSPKTQSNIQSNHSSTNVKSRDFATVSRSPTAKMGSPKQNANSSSTINPIRPQSIPASLKLSYNSHSPTYSAFNTQKRSVSVEEDSFSKNKHVLFPFSSTKKMDTQKISDLKMNLNLPNNNNYPPLSPIQRVANLTVKDPTKLFPNSSIEILKIPQKVTLNSNFKLPETIPLEKIKKSARMILPKSNNNFFSNEGTVTQAQYSNNSQIDDNYSGNFQSRFSVFGNDINLERYTLELKNDIAKLDRSLSMEKNYEHWEKQKLEEYNRIQQTNMAFLMSSKNQPIRSEISNQKSLSVRNVPNPSAITISRNQSINFNQNDLQKQFLYQNQHDVEDILVQNKISRSNDKFFPCQQKLSKTTDKKSIEKLTEILLNAAKSKDSCYEGDKNNNKKTSESTEVSSSSTFNDNSVSKKGKNEHFVSNKLKVSEIICLDT